MARRSIAKTAIEGGRAKFNREAEHEDDIKERRAWKAYCDAAARDEDAAEPIKIDTDWETGRSAREFRDKLRPVKRWLEKQVNRPWNKVRSDVIKTFDAKSLAGRHILGHVDGYVEKPEDKFRYNAYRWIYGPTARRRSGELYVDDKGFLRQEPKRSRKR